MNQVQGAARSKAMGYRFATAVGSSAILMWSTLAPLTTMTTGIPPIELVALTFGIAFFIGLGWLLATGGVTRLRVFRQPVHYWLLAVGALYGYHALYFLALATAPPAQASLIAYLWPLLIVVFSALTAAGGLRMTHIMGAVLGLIGTAILILTKHAGTETAPHQTLGLFAAFGCALIWSSYSVANRRFSSIPSDVMVGVCGVVAMLGILTHLIFEEQSVWPSSHQWPAVIGLGIGPVGLAFLTWDYGTKHGNVPVLGTLSYAAPVISTILLVILGRSPATLSLLFACALVVGGAWIATRRGREKTRPDTIRKGT
jgi:drug/metabolite transporter (DMT)-like permease